MENLYTDPLTEYGDLIPIDTWKELVVERDFIDYDGFGHAVKDNLMTKEQYYPSQMNKVPKDATHIMCIIDKNFKTLYTDRDILG